MTAKATLVPLESGDHLTREEFHRRYCARPDIRRAELIQGVVYVPTPMRFELHDEPSSNVIGWLVVYKATHGGVRQGNGGTIFLGSDDEVQPDAFLFYDPPRRPGGIRHTDDGYLEGAPDLVIEIAASSASKDLHIKMESYRRAGVPEYVVWRTLDDAIDWFVLRDGQYVRVEPDERGVITSEVFPGLRLNVPAMLIGDIDQVLAELSGRNAPPSLGNQESAPDENGTSNTTA
jgi:Uma2 family endonuclease